MYYVNLNNNFFKNNKNYCDECITGALLVKNSSAHVLRKTYFGGGTVAASSAQERFHVYRKSLSDR